MGSVLSVVSVAISLVAIPYLRFAYHGDVRIAVNRRLQFAQVRCMGKRQLLETSNVCS